MVLFKYSDLTDFEVDSSLLSSPDESERRIKASIIEGDKFADSVIDGLLWEIAQSKNNPFAQMSKEEIIMELKRMKAESDELRDCIIEAHLFGEDGKGGELSKHRDEINIKRQLLTNTFASRFDRNFIRLSLISNPEPFRSMKQKKFPQFEDGMQFEENRQFKDSLSLEEWLRKDYIKFVIDTMIKNGSFPSYGFASAVNFTNSGEDLFQWSETLKNDHEKKRAILSKMDELTRGKKTSEVYRVVVSAWFGGYLLNLPTDKQLQAQFPQHTIKKQNYHLIKPSKEVLKYDKDFGRYKTFVDCLDDEKISTYLEELDKAIKRPRILKRDY